MHTKWVRTVIARNAEYFCLRLFQIQMRFITMTSDWQIAADNAPTFFRVCLVLFSLIKTECVHRVYVTEKLRRLSNVFEEPIFPCCLIAAETRYGVNSRSEHVKAPDDKKRNIEVA